jgi:hypothetical protein
MLSQSYSKQQSQIYTTSQTGYDLKKDKNDERYTSDRSPSMAFGKITVSFGDNTSWVNLVESSNSVKRKTEYKMHITSTDELIRFPPTPLAFTVQGGHIQPVKDQVYLTYQKKTISGHPFKTFETGQWKGSCFIYSWLQELTSRTPHELEGTWGAGQ